MSLTKSEEELMQHLWKIEKAFMKDLLECYPEPKPATTTVATLLKRMQEKGYIEYKQLGRSRQYYPPGEDDLPEVKRELCAVWIATVANIDFTFSSCESGRFHVSRAFAS